MEKFDSISHFLQTEEFNYRVFDMGRKVCEIPNELFEKIENQQTLYPYPFQQKAWLALLFWPESKEDKAVIWFLQFPIDELGYLKQQSRDAFLIDLLEQTGKNIQAKQTGNVTQDELGESPFAFKPRADRLAMFHAIATVTLSQPPSQHYQDAHDYLLDKIEGGPGLEQWQFLGLQGISDVVARLQSDNNQALLSKAVVAMPNEPLHSYCYALENVQFDVLLFEALLSRLWYELDSEDKNNVNIAAIIRAISSQPANQSKISALSRVLKSSVSSEIEILAAISGRSWADLENTEILQRFVENLALQEQQAFNAIVADLIMIPGMRERILDVIRSENRSQEMAQKFGAFMQAISG